MNPYEPPKSEPPPAPASASVAVFIGAAIANGVSYALQLLMSVVLLWVLTGQGVAVQDLYARAYQATGYAIFAHGVGVLCCAAGGYWSARLGPERPYRHAILAACLIAAFSLTTEVMPYDLPIPLWSRIASLLLPFPGFLLGACLWKRSSPPEPEV